jgi:wyosine [tRNA(Phe)-imidazoG37] synthetase (radical SAM superfamily)
MHLHTQHQRLFETNKFVYPVLSRRSGGISVGVNLNPDKVCNFDCVYCQVDRTSQSPQRFVEVDRLLDELRGVLELASSGQLYQTEKFSAVPPAMRRLNDIAFSGDGEPTTFVNFDELMDRSAHVKRSLGLDEVKMVLITNASMFHRPRVQEGLSVLDASNGEIWAKLDAGTQDYYKQIMRTVIPLSRVMENITAAAQVRPLVIQSLYCTLDGEGPSDAELLAYCDRLNDVTAAGGQLKLIQIYTVARKPAESIVGPLEDAEVDRIVALVRKRTSLRVEGFYGTSEY